ncbi:MAG: hypothetical protein GTO22_21370 [Gemmatimonadales bacterium]|nr:hypothetical protein [Gemmatimonadales bacterium]
MPWYVLVVFLAISLVAFHSFFRAYSNLAAKRQLMTVLALGICAGRRYFTPVGWRYWKRGFALQLAAFIIALILWGVSGWQ